MKESTKSSGSSSSSGGGGAGGAGGAGGTDGGIVGGDSVSKERFFKRVCFLLELKISSSKQTR